MPKMKLYFVPHAGGSAMGYLTMKRFIDPENVEVVPLELAGRGTRIKEPCYKSVEEDAKDLYERIKEDIEDTDYAIFGHSLGTVITYELTKLIEQNKKPIPKCLFLSGRGGPGYDMGMPSVADLPEEEFASYFIKNQGIPEEMQHSKELMRLLLPVLRTDVKKAEQYEEKQVEKITSDIVAVYGVEDNLCNREGMRAWGELSNGTYKEYAFSGGHFYFTKHRQELGECIAKVLKTYRVGGDI